MRRIFKITCTTFVFLLICSFTDDCTKSDNPCACRWNLSVSNALAEYSSNTLHCYQSWAPQVCMLEADAIFDRSIEAGWNKFMSC